MADNGNIVPRDALTFRFQLNKQLLATITINNNPSDKRLAFKIKTTAPKKYVVRPSSGVAEPNSAVSVQVIMQAQKEYPPDFAACKDKFMVQTVLLDEDEQIDKDTFTKEVRPDVKEARLKVILEGPASPPSPVPEANETEGDDLLRLAGGASAGAAAAGASDATKLRHAKDDLSHATAEIAALRSSLAKITAERDDVRKQLDMIQLQGVHAKGGAGGGHEAVAADPALKFRITIVHFILVAIVAFMIGHYT